MQIKEKLKVFRQSTIEVARQESKAQLEEYEKQYKEELESFREKKQQELEHTFQLEKIRLIREVNRKVSTESMRQRQVLEECQNEKEEKTFKMVEQKLLAFQQTEAYENYLVAQIKKVIAFARQEEVVIYINSNDKEKKQQLEERTGVTLTVSTVDFGGGIRAVIPAKNILVDESFATKLEQEKNSYVC